MDSRRTRPRIAIAVGLLSLVAWLGGGSLVATGCAATGAGAGASAHSERVRSTAARRHRVARRSRRRAPARVVRVSEDSTATWVTAVATGVAAFAAILAFAVAVLTIVDNRRTTKERITYESVERLEDLELISHQAVMSSFLRGGFQPPSVPDASWANMTEPERIAVGPAMWQHLSSSSSVEDRKTVLQILAFPNMLETLAGMYNHGLLDYGVVKTRVENQAISFWTRAEWWIEAVREHDGERIFKDLEVMMEDLATRERPQPYNRETRL